MEQPRAIALIRRDFLGGFLSLRDFVRDKLFIQDKMHQFIWEVAQNWMRHKQGWLRRVAGRCPGQILQCNAEIAPIHTHTCTYMHIHAHTCISHLDIFLLIKQKYMYIHGTYMHIHQDANMIQSSDTCTYSDLNLNFKGPGVA